MDSGTLIIGAIFLAIAFSPVLFFTQGRRKAKKAILNMLDQVASQSQSKISKREFFGDFAIGIDENTRTVFYVKRERDIVQQAVVNLADILDCKVLSIAKTIKSKEDKAGYQVIERLDLSFTPKAKNKPETKLNFYTSTANSQIDGELQAVENWSKTIKDILMKTASKQN